MRFGIHPVIPVRDGMVLRFPGNSHQSIHHGGSQYCYGHHHEFSINVMVYNQWYGLWSSSWVLISKPHIGIEETEIGTSWGHIQRGLFSDRMGTSNKIQSSLEFEYRLPKHWWFIIFFPIESCSPLTYPSMGRSQWIGGIVVRSGISAALDLEFWPTMICLR